MGDSKLNFCTDLRFGVLLKNQKVSYAHLCVNRDIEGQRSRKSFFEKISLLVRQKFLGFILKLALYRKTLYKRGNVLFLTNRVPNIALRGRSAHFFK